MRAWLAYPGVQDTGTLRVVVRDMQEPPSMVDAVSIIPEIIEGGVKPSVSAAAGVLLQHAVYVSRAILGSFVPQCCLPCTSFNA